MKILGISCFYHDSAASIVIDNKIVAAVQEERFTRIKHTPDFPSNSIKFWELTYYFGSKKQYKDVAHHTIYFGKSYEEHLNKIFEKKILSEDISYYLHRPSATDPNMAPAGQDAFYVLVPVPNSLSNINWSNEGNKFKNLILDKMDKSVLPGIRENVVSDFYLTPDYFENELATLYGSGFSIQPKFSQSAYFRFHNQSEVFKNLYFVGAGTHPGAGMPGVLSSAKVLDKLF